MTSEPTTRGRERERDRERERERDRDRESCKFEFLLKFSDKNFTINFSEKPTLNVAI